MQLNHVEKRWLEINFYLLCSKIYNNRKEYEDVENFFKAFDWTNLYDCDTLIKTFNNLNILNNPKIIPSKREFLVCVDQPSKLCRFRYSRKALRELARPLGYRTTQAAIYRQRMRQEVKEYRITLFPKITSNKFHDAYYSFLLTLQYFSKTLTVETRI